MKKKTRLTIVYTFVREIVLDSDLVFDEFTDEEELKNYPYSVCPDAYSETLKVSLASAQGEKRPEYGDETFKRLKKHTKIVKIENFEE